jgi:hypothetical protein
MEVMLRGGVRLSSKQWAADVPKTTRQRWIQGPTGREKAGKQRNVARKLFAL